MKYNMITYVTTKIVVTLSSKVYHNTSSINCGCRLPIRSVVESEYVISNADSVRSTPYKVKKLIKNVGSRIQNRADHNVQCRCHGTMSILIGDNQQITFSAYIPCLKQYHMCWVPIQLTMIPHWRGAHCLQPERQATRHSGR